MSRHATTCHGTTGTARPMASAPATITAGHGEPHGKWQGPRYATAMFHTAYNIKAIPTASPAALTWRAAEIAYGVHPCMDGLPASHNSGQKPRKRAPLSYVVYERGVQSLSRSSSARKKWLNRCLGVCGGGSFVVTRKLDAATKSMSDPNSPFERTAAPT